jgi:hypothetical protein
MKRGLYWHFTTIVSLSQGSSFSQAPYFLSVGSRHFTMSSKRREYHVDCRSKKAALFFLACEANPATRLSIPTAMRAKGYLDVEAVDQILEQQVRRESQKKAPKILLVPSLRPHPRYWPW